MSNDPILDSKVVPDELGQLGRPAERAGQPGGRASPAGRPGRLAGRWAASQEGNEGRAQEGAQRAGADGAPPLLSPQVGYLVLTSYFLYFLSLPFNFPAFPLRFLS